MTTEPKLPAKRPYVAPELERIDLVVKTRAGGSVATDSIAGFFSTKAAS